MAKKVRISLANKCQLLFGTAVVLILTSALTLLAVRMQTLVYEGQLATARQMANMWLADLALQSEPPNPLQYLLTDKTSQQVSAMLIDRKNFDAASEENPFLARAIELFGSDSSRRDLFVRAKNYRSNEIDRYAMAIRRSTRNLLPKHLSDPLPIDETTMEDPVEAIVLIRLPADLAQGQLLLNRVYIIAAGLLAGLLAIGTFWFITTRIILSPVRVLRDTAAKVSAGDLNIRSDINTGDEFEQMSDMFNTMLENLKSNQDQLRSINKSLDLKIGELAQHNVALHEANLIKGQFLANVSHELRTPLNSIIGFAEVLAESVQGGNGQTADKHKRYITHIIASSRQLLDLINDLLDLAKIEAGRVELRVSQLSISDSAEGLINLIRPQAEKRDIELRLRIERGIPLIHTDAVKFQQILFNFLSNAIKFTPTGGTVTLSAHLQTDDPEPAGKDDQTECEPLLCVSVCDTGPGIPPNQHEHIFDKFTQLDSTVTREHGGTGLGLAISRELASLLQGRIELVSTEDEGATFSLLIPQVLESKSVPLMPDLKDASSNGPRHDPIG